MRNIHLDFMQRARFCDPTGGFATMGVLMAVGAAAGGVSAYGQYQQGQAKKAMYHDAAMNTDLQAMVAKQNTAQNIELTKRQMDANVAAEQMDASMASKEIAEKELKTQGTAQVAEAAMGMGGGSVTKADITTDILTESKKDQMAVRYKADAESANIINAGNEHIWALNNDLQNEVWSLGQQRTQYEKAAKNEGQAGNMAAAGTILSTAASVGGQAWKMKYGRLPRYGSRYGSSAWTPGEDLLG